MWFASTALSVPLSSPRLLLVDKQEDVLGTFAPTLEPHVVDLPVDEAPEGFFKRGSYKGKSMVAAISLTCRL